MTTITRNLPWFIRDLGISIVGKRCYTSLVENLDITDVKCLKYSFSKGLGLGIVVGGSIMKVPQLILILNANSARGLSLTAYVLETLAYAITTAYAYRNEYPFSTYGENFFLTIQNTVITLLIIYYPSASPKKSQNVIAQIALTFVLMVASYFALLVVPKDVLSLLQVSTLPLSLFSKLPQIIQNARSQSTGQLSAFAVIAQILGCLARLFTTATEVGDLIVTAGFALALLLNVILGVQLWVYWGKDGRDGFESHPIGVVSEKERESWAAPERQSRVEVVVTPKSPVPRHTASPSGRKWSRKVD